MRGGNRAPGRTCSRVGPKRSFGWSDSRPAARSADAASTTRSSRRRRRPEPAAGSRGERRRSVRSDHHLRRIAREGQQSVIAELIPEDDVGRCPDGVHEPHRGCGCHAAPMTQHGHQRDNPRSTSDEKRGRLPAPNEVRGERAADLDLVALDNDLVEVRGDFAVGEQVDRQLDPALVEARRQPSRGWPR